MPSEIVARYPVARLVVAQGEAGSRCGEGTDRKRQLSRADEQGIPMGNSDQDFPEKARS